jgi:hypothetical protein
MRHWKAGWGLLAVVAIASAMVGLVGCAGDDTNTTPADAGGPSDATVVDAAPKDAGGGSVDGTVTSEDGGPVIGALITVSMPSTVGVLLDEIPLDDRDRVAAVILAKPTSYWVTRAHAQIKLTAYHLVFRTEFYPDGFRQQLPIAPESQWLIGFSPGDAGDDDGGTAEPYRMTTTDGHDVVAVDYTLQTTVLTDQDSPGVSEPSLQGIGGIWNEPFTFPIDPEQILQRTGYACMDEAEFPPNSVDSEETDSFYDWTCDIEPVESPDGCHYSALPQISCLDALTASVGQVSTQATFERIPWDPGVADQVRVGPITNDAGADLQVITEEFESHRVTYRYIPPDSCTLVEQCVGAPGWRRVLQFSTADKNTGTETVDIGGVDYFSEDGGTDGDTQPETHNAFEWSACHHHWHFTHYGEFDYGDGGAPGNHKRGFCLQSTTRSLNIETSPTHNPYGDCTYQGIAQGWGDEYKIGLDCQWIDVTDYDTSQAPYTSALQFTSNPDGFLCEGTPVLDDAGEQVWEPTAFTTEAGAVVDRPKCNFWPPWFANNHDQYDVTVPTSGNGFVTTACVLGEIGPVRNCGFALAPANNLLACTPGAASTLKCSVPAGSTPQVARVCESSIALQSGTACKFNEALANGIVEAAADGGVSTVSIPFTCPASRDTVEVGGKYSLYTAPVLTDDAPQTVTCALQ